MLGRLPSFGDSKLQMDSEDEFRLMSSSFGGGHVMSSDSNPEKCFKRVSNFNELVYSHIFPTVLLSIIQLVGGRGKTKARLRGSGKEREEAGLGDAWSGLWGHCSLR